MLSQREGRILLENEQQHRRSKQAQPAWHNIQSFQFLMRSLESCESHLASRRVLGNAQRNTAASKGHSFPHEERPQALQQTLSANVRRLLSCKTTYDSGHPDSAAKSLLEPARELSSVNTVASLLVPTRIAYAPRPCPPACSPATTTDASGIQSFIFC
jgi:hypothetical protein